MSAYDQIMPTVPGCGLPAQWQVFACTPPVEGSRYGRPAGVAYSCAGHTVQTANILSDVGLMVATVDLARNPAARGRVCGDVADLRPDSGDELPDLLARLGADPTAWRGAER